MFKKILFLLLAAFLLFPLYAQNEQEEENRDGLKGGAQFAFTKNESNRYYEFSPFFSYTGGPFTVLGELSALNDGKYSDTANQGYFSGMYFVVNEGGFIYDLGKVKIRTGVLSSKDEIDSPYSLFVSSEKLSTLMTEVSFEDHYFVYKTRWLRLNENSANLMYYTDNINGITYPDRGANYHMFALKFGNFRIGYQDAAVYDNRSFDPKYFFNPVPVFFISEIYSSEGTPYAEDVNDGSIMGLFADYRKAGKYFYTQLLVDDINLNAIVNPSSIEQNPSKIAFSIGGSGETRFGFFALSFAMATKYTFQPYGSSAGETTYSYTYFPASAYYDGNDAVALNYLDNYIGYKYGENNLAVKLDYSNYFFQDKAWAFRLYAGLEYVVSGSKSPTNPWGDLTHWKKDPEPGTHFLDGSKLEHTVKTSAKVSRKLGAFDVSADVVLGYVVNELAFVPVSGSDDGLDGDEINGGYWFVPSDKSRMLYSLTLGAKYSFNTLKD
jgi:hypothetical protein